MVATAEVQRSIVFTGAVFADFAVYFPVSSGGTFRGAAFSAPAGVRTMLVVGLKPQTRYGISFITHPEEMIVNVSPEGNNATSNASGVLRVTF